MSRDQPTPLCLRSLGIGHAFAPHVRAPSVTGHCWRALIAIGVFCWPAIAGGWGDEGHRITGHIARALLSEAARAEVRALLGHDDLAAIATQLDDQREAIERRHPGAARWHYENRSVCTATIACPQGHCLTRQLERLRAVLRDRGAPRERRKEALIFVVHLLGDLHQPLHLADNQDRGGNDTWVRLPHDREPRRLHAVWDTQLVRRLLKGQPVQAFARDLLKQVSTQRTEWTQGDIEAWAQETQHLGARAYRMLPQFACPTRSSGSHTPIALSESYVTAATHLVAEQLAKAGVRMAAELNAALGAR